MDMFKCDRWDARFFAMADFVASWSEDQSRRVGCVVVGDANEVRSTGYNGLPRGVSGEPASRHSRENGEKYLWFEHAERNALFNMLRAGVATSNCRMYCNSFPCADCARAIIQSGITELRTYAPDLSDTKFGRHFEVAMEMLKEGGVCVKLYSRQDKSILRVFSTLEEVRDPKHMLLR